MNENTRYLVGCWIVVGTLLLIPVGGFLLISADALQRGEWVKAVTILAMFVGGTFSAIMLWRSKWRGAEREFRRLLQSPTPDDLIGWLHNIKRSGINPNGDASRAQGCAVIYTLYGDFESARYALQDIDWENRLPVIHGCGLTARALLCYLGSREYERGLRLARQAQELGTTSSLVPWARTSAGAFAAFVETGEVLCGEFSEETVKSLEAKRFLLPGTGKLVVAWALAVAYHRMRNTPKAEEMIAFLREVAPHCRALVIPPDLEKL